jgi:hypothetical protein
MLAAALDDSHVASALQQLWADGDGAGVVWSWVEWLREFVAPFVAPAGPG